MIEEEPTRIRALLRVPESLRRVHAAARAGRQLPGAVRRLGRRGAVFVPADRLLVPEDDRPPTPARRRSSSTASATSRSSSACCWPSRSSAPINFKELNGAIARLPADGDVRRRLDDRAAAVHRRDRQVGADSALRLVAGRDGRPDAGLRADPRRDDGDGRRVSDRPQRRAVRACARGADDRRGHRHGDGAVGRRRSAWCRTTSSACWRTRPSRSSATCSWRWASARTRPASSTCSRTRSSRRCCSSDRAR